MNIKNGQLWKWNFNIYTSFHYWHTSQTLLYETSSISEPFSSLFSLSLDFVGEDVDTFAVSLLPSLEFSASSSSPFSSLISSTLSASSLSFSSLSSSMAISTTSAGAEGLGGFSFFFSLRSWRKAVMESELELQPFKSTLE